MPDFERVVDYPDDGVKVGNGWNPEAGTKTPAVCIDFDVAEDHASEKTAEIRRVVDRSSLMRNLDVSADLQVKALLWKVSGKAKFASTLDVKEESSSFTVHAVVENGARYVAPRNNNKIDLKPEYAKLANTDLPRFLRDCGTAFVAAIHGGAELSALLTFQTRSSQEREELATSIEGGGWGVHLNAEYKSKLQTYSESNRLTVYYHQSGGEGTPIPTDQAQLQKRIEELAKDAASAPKFYRMSLLRYDALPSWPSGRSINWQYASLAALARLHGQLSTLHSAIETIRANSSAYVLNHGVTVESLRQLQDDVQTRLASLETIAQACLDYGGDACTVPDSVRIVDYEVRRQLPVRASSFAEDIELSRARTELATLRQELASTPKQIPPPPIDRVMGDAMQIIFARICSQDPGKCVNPDYAKKARTVADREAYVRQLEDAYPAALRRAVLAQWIEYASKDRCRRSFADPLCLKNRDLDAWASRIPVN